MPASENEPYCVTATALAQRARQLSKELRELRAAVKKQSGKSPSTLAAQRAAEACQLLDKVARGVGRYSDDLDEAATGLDRMEYQQEEFRRVQASGSP